MSRIDPRRLSRRPARDIWPPFVDLMGGVVLFLMLVLLVAILKNQRATEDVQKAYQKSRVAHEVHKKAAAVVRGHVGVRRDLIKDLIRSLGGLVDIDRDTGFIRIGEDRLTFALDSAEIDLKGQIYLDKVLPKLTKVVFGPPYNRYLSKISVEGYTDSSVAPEDPYYNWRLSSERALSVVKYLLDHCGIQIKQCKQYLEAVGMADKDLVRDKVGIEIPEKSRRIEIKILLNDRDVMDQLATEIETGLKRNHEQK